MTSFTNKFLNNIKILIKLFLLKLKFLPIAYIQNLYNNQFLKKILPISPEINIYFKNIFTKGNSSFKINKGTKISNIGSCYGVRVSNFLSKGNYNYLQYEDNITNASVNWGHVYNIENLCQIINYSINENYKLIIEKCKNGYFDPLRASTIGYYKTLAEAKKKILRHRKKSYLLFKNVDVLIITIGQNEGWFDKKNNIVWGFNPPFDFQMNKKRFEYKEFDFNQNLKSLKKVLYSLKKFNKDLKIIFAVGPVSNYTTFLENNVICQSYVEKSNLRLVFHLLEKDKRLNVAYFPLLEMVHLNNNKNFSLDNRHISNKLIKKIDDCLQTFLKF